MSLHSLQNTSQWSVVARHQKSWKNSKTRLGVILQFVVVLPTRYRYIHIAVQTPTQPTPRSVAKLWIGTTRATDAHRGRRETMSNAQDPDPFKYVTRDLCFPNLRLIFFRKMYFFPTNPHRASPTPNNSSCPAPRPTNRPAGAARSAAAFEGRPNLPQKRPRPTLEKSRKAPYAIRQPLGTLE